MPLNSFVIIKN